MARKKKAPVELAQAVQGLVEEAAITPLERAEFNHVLRRAGDYVEFTRVGGPLAGGVIATAIKPPSPDIADGSLIRVYSRAQQSSEGAYVDRPMYDLYVEKGKYF